MLIIILHNKEEVLEYFINLALKINIAAIKIVRRKGIGSVLMGPEADFVLSRGRIRQKYDKAFITVIEDKKKSKKFLKAVEEDVYLNMINFHEKAFICAVPFHDLEQLVPAGLFA